MPAADVSAATVKPARRNAGQGQLSPKRQRFVDEYLIDLNATAAYIRAGYRAVGHCANVSASRLLHQPMVAQQVQRAMDTRSVELGIDARFVLTTIKATIDRCSQAEPVMAYDKELLGKHLKMFTDKVEMHGKNGGPIEQKVDLTIAPEAAYLKMIGK
jgi:phage terminase small subunit